MDGKLSPHGTPLSLFNITQQRKGMILTRLVKRKRSSNALANSQNLLSGLKLCRKFSKIDD
jgi:hypothetical protein